MTEDDLKVSPGLSQSDGGAAEATWPPACDSDVAPGFFRSALVAAFPFLFDTAHGDTAVGLGLMVADDGKTWTWLHSSRSRPVRLVPSEWPNGLARSVDIRNTARHGEEKGRVLIVRHGPHAKPEKLKPVAALCWHAHPGNWPLTALDAGYVLGLDAALGKLLVNDYLFAALAELNDHRRLQDRAVPRPTDRLGWGIRQQSGAGSDPAWARAVATRAQAEWNFKVIRQKRLRPAWARSGFYAERPR
jgi:hypothetical protein